MQWNALAVDDPLLLREPEVPEEIGITWFLDRDIPSHMEGMSESLKSCYSGKNASVKQEKELQRASLYGCMEPHRGWTIASSSCNF